MVKESTGMFIRSIISNLYIFPLISRSDIFCIQGLSNQTRCNTIDNVHLALRNCRYSIYDTCSNKKLSLR